MPKLVPRGQKRSSEVKIEAPFEKKKPTEVGSVLRPKFTVVSEIVPAQSNSYFTINEDQMEAVPPQTFGTVEAVNEEKIKFLMLKDTDAIPGGRFNDRVKHVQLTNNQTIVLEPSCPVCVGTLSGKSTITSLCGHMYCEMCFKQAILGGIETCIVCDANLKYIVGYFDTPSA